MDLAGMLTESERQDLADFAYEIYANNGPQITILTVENMQGYPIEEFSIRVAEKWELGTKEKDNGLLVVIAKEEHQMRIEVGNGIEGEMTDYDTTKYTRQLWPEYFRRGEFHDGLKIFMEDVADKFQIKTDPGNRVIRRAPERSPIKGGNFIIIAIVGILAFGAMLFNKKPVARGIFTGIGFSGVSLLMGIPIAMLIIIFLFGLVLGLVGVGNFLTALLMSGRGGGGRYGGGGGFGGGGGGGWSGGGGGFSGGGSSGNW